MQAVGGLGDLWPVTIRFTNTKNCFLHLPPHVVAHLHLQQGQPVELSWGTEPVYLSWVDIRHSCNTCEYVAELNRQLGEKLGIKDRDQVFIKPCSQVLSCKQVTVEPLSVDDWEILELHALSLERLLLDQIRIVYTKGIFPVWVEQHTCIYIKVGALKPDATYGRLEALTELFVSPKTRQQGGDENEYASSKSGPTYGNPSNQNTDYEQAPQKQYSKEPYSHFVPDRTNPPHPKDRSNANTGPSIWGLMSSIFYGKSETSEQIPLTENELNVFEQTSLSLDHVDAVFRVFRCRPHIQQSIFSVPTKYELVNSVHVFPWNIEPAHLEPPITVTFGKLAKLLSPRQQQERTKQNILSEKQKQNAPLQSNKQSGQNSSQETSLTSMVKIVWHGYEDLKDDIKYNTRNAALHVGNVWIPDDLRKRLNIEIYAAVRITSFNTIPKIPNVLLLQPKFSLDSDVTEQDINSAFISWLQSSIDITLPWIMGHTDNLHFPVKKRMTEFVLSVVQSSKNEDPVEKIFMLSPDFLQKISIQIVDQQSQFLLPIVEGINGWKCLP